MHRKEIISPILESVYVMYMASKLTFKRRPISPQIWKNVPTPKWKKGLKTWRTKLKPAPRESTNFFESVKTKSNKQSS